MGLLLHLAATAAIVLFVWSSLHLASVRVPRAGQVEFALWLLSSDRAAPWWKIQPTVSGALANGGRPNALRLAGAAGTSAGAVACSLILWAAASWPDFDAWRRLLVDWPAANATLVCIPALFVVGAVYLAQTKSDRIATGMAGNSAPAKVAAWIGIDLLTTLAIALLGWAGFLASLIVSGREQELAHLWTRASIEMSAGWPTGLGLAADRSGWPSWGVWFYAILTAAMLPWLHVLGAVLLRGCVGRARPIIERIDSIGLINLENRPLAAIAMVAALAAGAGYMLIAIASAAIAP
jgi:hypothetical protein